MGSISRFVEDGIDVFCIVNVWSVSKVEFGVNQCINYLNVNLS